MDAVVAGLVFGAETFLLVGPDGKDTDTLLYEHSDGVVPHYSTDMRAAWEVVNALGGIVRITRLASEWHVQFQGGRECWADDAPLAICYAALSAVEQREASDA